METWEVILILGLITISLMVLLNHNIPLNLISLLDNSLFQLTVVGLTLTIASISPPVAIVAIATIVIVFYVRNLNKVQLITNKPENPVKLINKGSDNQAEHVNPEPRLIIEEVETKTQYLKIQDMNGLDNSAIHNLINKNAHLPKTVEQNDPVKNGVTQKGLAEHVVTSAPTTAVPTTAVPTTAVPTTAVPTTAVVDKKPTAHVRPEDKDVLDIALKEHKVQDVKKEPTNYKIPCPIPVQDVKEILQDNYPNPRSGPEGFQVESTDPKVKVYGSAPRKDNSVPDGENGFSVESNIYSRSESVPLEYNELSAQPTTRPYDKSEGQFMIKQQRPYENPQKYEVADFAPGNDMGDNTFVTFGNSIDDKITNLKKGIQTSTAPPPNFDTVEPAAASKQAM